MRLFFAVQHFDGLHQIPPGGLSVFGIEPNDFSSGVEQINPGQHGGGQLAEKGLVRVEITGYFHADVLQFLADNRRIVADVDPYHFYPFSRIRIGQIALQIVKGLVGRQTRISRFAFGP